MPQAVDPDLVHSVSRPFHMRRPVVVARRRRWPGVLAAVVIAVGLAAFAVWGQDVPGYAGAPPDAAIAPTASPVERRP